MFKWDLIDWLLALYVVMAATGLHLKVTHDAEVRTNIEQTCAQIDAIAIQTVSKKLVCVIAVKSDEP